MERIFKYRVSLHLLFWCCFIGAYTILLGSKFGYGKTLGYVTAQACVYAIIVYINILWLIPVFLQKGRYAYYILSLLLAIVPIVLLEAYVEYQHFYNTRELQGNILIPKLLFLSFLNVFTMVMLTTGLKFGKAYFVQRQEKEILEKEKLQSELRFLKSQINPHFLFNTLNNLYSLTLKKSDRAPELVLKLSEMMRYMLYDSNEPKVLLEKEVNCVRNYIDLEKIRQGGGTQISLSIEGTVNGQTIAPLLFIPFLENSFKHGVNSSIEDAWVNIALEVEGKQLQLLVENSKPTGNVATANKSNSGIGLQNVKRRLDLLYPGRHELNIDDKPDTYKTLLKLDLS